MKLWSRYLRELFCFRPLLATSFGGHTEETTCVFDCRIAKKIETLNRRFLSLAAYQLRNSGPDRNELLVFCKYLQNRINCVELDHTKMFAKEGGWIVEVMDILDDDQPYVTFQDLKKAKNRFRTIEGCINKYIQALKSSARVYPPSKLVLSEMIERIKNRLEIDSENIPDDLKKDYDQNVRTQVSQKLVPFLERLLHQRVRPTCGLAYLHNGRSMYDAAILLHCGLKIPAKTIYDFGMKRIQALTEKLQFTPLPEDMPSFTPSEVVSKYKEICKRLQTTYLGTIVGDLSLANECTVQEMDEHDALNGPMAYYENNVFYVNTLYEHPIHKCEALAFHECFPGHHLQQDIELQFAKDSDYRFFCPHTGFVEGWAVYAEQLLTPVLPYGSIGVLESELFRAVRLVVDTGIHAMKWSCTDAYNFLKLHCSMEEEEARSEISRYASDPAQSIGYYIGMLVFQAIGSKTTDLIAVHQEILKNGSVPLEMLLNKYDIQLDDLMK